MLEGKTRETEERRSLTDQQRAVLIEAIADGKRLSEIKEIAKRNGFSISESSICYHKKVYVNEIIKCTTEEWKNLGAVVGFARRAERIALRDELTRRLYQEATVGTDGIDASKRSYVKSINELLDSIRNEVKDTEPSQVSKIQFLSDSEEFNPSNLTDEQLKEISAALCAVTLKETEMNYDNPEVTEEVPNEDDVEIEGEDDE